MESHLDFEDMNLLRPDPEAGPVLGGQSQRQISLRCPHCLQQGTFVSLGHHPVSFGKSKSLTSKTQRTSLEGRIYICPNLECQSLLFAVSAGRHVVLSYPLETMDFDANGIPSALISTLKEAIACHSVGAFRASAMMVRRLLEELCQDADAKGNNLHQRLETLKAKVMLPEELFSAMFELKALGNDAAHVEAKQYSQIDRLGAEVSIEIAKEILKSRYQLGNLLQRIRSLKAE